MVLWVGLSPVYSWDRRAICCLTYARNADAALPSHAHIISKAPHYCTTKAPHRYHMASTTKDKLTAAAAGAAIALVVSRYLKKQAPYDATHDEVRAIVRPNIRKLEPYRCARDDYEEGVLLDAICFSVSAFALQ